MKFLDLFDEVRKGNKKKFQPLAARMRPRTIEEFVGQSHFFGPGKILRRLVQANQLTSIIFYGPAGTGKTALAQVIAHHLHGRFERVNAVESGSKEIRDLLRVAKENNELYNERTILFLDEIHRFNASQQDILLPVMEEGIVTLIGATTQNPFFAINAPLISRSQIFSFQPLDKDEIKTILRRALTDHERGYGNKEINAQEEALEYLAMMSEGDARKALTSLEIAVLASEQTPILLSKLSVQEAIQKKSVAFDPTGDLHYDLVSAFIKSIRGSDPDAAIYWLARMLEGGEEPRFIARRLVICASEDIGNADLHALTLAVNSAQAVEMVGLPECQLALAHATIYLACCPKSNAITTAILSARKAVREEPILQIPAHLRDSHYSGAKTFGHGVEYLYPHDFPHGWVEQEYLPEKRLFYQPTDRGNEKKIADFMKKLKIGIEEKETNKS